jgi:hypothetical protein
MIIPSSEQIPDVGNRFNITCTVYGLDSVDPKFAYQWTNESGHSIASSSSENTVVFSALELANAGKYKCEVNVSSNYFVNGHVIGRNTYNLSIKSKQMYLITNNVNYFAHMHVALFSSPRTIVSYSESIIRNDLCWVEFYS